MTEDKTPELEIPYRGFSPPAEEPSSPALVRRTVLEEAAPTTPTPVDVTRPSLSSRLFAFLGPRRTDIQQLIRKLENQLQQLQIEVLKYEYGRSGEKDSVKDPNHPVNDPSISHEVHFVGRSARDPSIIQLSTFLTQHDMFGAITELWLSNNLISDAGAESIAKYLELPRCPVVELWLGQNHIGPGGTALISAALSSNGKSRLKCLGLNQNPIENGGANCLAQMLRGNHTLVTVDLHGCMYSQKSGREEDEVEYGCKVIKSDGNEYIAKIDPSTSEEKAGYVTDKRLLDSITTFSAFNKINPTREQAIRGLMLRNRRAKAGVKAAQDAEAGDNGKASKHEALVSAFLSHLCTLPSTECLTDEEKKRWKDCEWEMLYTEIERVRNARSALEQRLSIHDKEDEHSVEEDDEEENSGQGLLDESGEKDERLGRNLDDEVVHTETRTWRQLKMGIAGSSKVLPKSNNKNTVSFKRVDSAPPNPFKEDGMEAADHKPPAEAFTQKMPIETENNEDAAAASEGGASSD